MNAGRLRHRIVIEQQVKARDATSGAETITWQTYQASVPAELMPMSGKEFQAANAQQSETLTRCLIRYLPGLDETMRVTHDGVEYNIRAILPDRTLRRHLNLMLASGANDGR